MVVTIMRNKEQGEFIFIPKPKILLLFLIKKKKKN